jgi:hypothetical protein
MDGADNGDEKEFTPFQAIPVPGTLADGGRFNRTAMVSNSSAKVKNVLAPWAGGYC